MKRLLVVALAALAACGGSTSSSPLTAEEARTALPSADQARIGAPGAQGAATATAAVGAVQAAEYAVDTIVLTAAVNGGVAAWLGTVAAVVTLPPSGCAGDTCTWGPGSGALEVNVWQLVVTRKADRDFVWALQGRPKSDPSAPFVTVVSGEAFTTGVRYVGHGTLLADLDAAATGLAHLTGEQVGKGQIAVTYDNTSGSHVSATFTGMPDATTPSQTVNTAYQFASTTTGGDLQLASHNLSTDAVLKLHSRWTPTGAGRGDASFTLLQTTFTRSQCWDSAGAGLALLYQVTDPADPSDAGDAAACAFATAAPTDLPVP